MYNSQYWENESIQPSKSSIVIGYSSLSQGTQSFVVSLYIYPGLHDKHP